MVHFEDKGMFPKVHWRILEDSGRFLARIPWGLGLNPTVRYRTIYRNWSMVTFKKLLSRNISFSKIKLRASQKAMYIT